MIENYFKIAWRNLWKNKIFSFINILGLTIGITVCMMIFLFILNEFSVDKFHENGKNIYRVMRDIRIGYYAMNNWLQDFAYRTAIHWWIFVLAAAITIAIALLTVSFKAVKAAIANPVDSLRSE